MSEIFKIESITQLNSILNQEKPKHPLVGIVDMNKIYDNSFAETRISAGFYSISLKNTVCGKLKYGRQNYDFEEGTLVFLAPEQVIEVEPNEVEKPITSVKSWGLFFHPDLLKGTSLASKMKAYSFFAYSSNEALHLSDKEREIVLEIIEKIEYELLQNIDKHTQNLIVSSIELLLNYCLRFYDRQFITRTAVNKDVLSDFEAVLLKSFQSKNNLENGLPTVKWCAEKLNLTPNYLSDLLKKETGKNAQEHIHYFLIEEAKEKLLGSNNSISEIAYGLGFEYPQYFSKLFKKKTGMSPVEYRALN